MSEDPFAFAELEDPDYENKVAEKIRAQMLSDAKQDAEQRREAALQAGLPNLNRKPTEGNLDAKDLSKLIAARELLNKKVTDMAQNNPAALKEQTREYTVSEEDLAFLQQAKRIQQSTDIGDSGLRAQRIDANTVRIVQKAPQERGHSFDEFSYNAPLKETAATRDLTARQQNRDQKQKESGWDFHRYVTKRSEEPQQKRVALPSNFIFYDFKELFIEPPTLDPHLIQLATAQNQQDLTAFIDLIDSLCSVDVRDLCIPDFYFLLYNLRVVHFLDNYSYTLSWTSKYGNHNQFKFNKSHLKTIELPLHLEQTYREFYDQGFRIPTMRDLELLRTELEPHNDMEKIYIWLRAQTLYGKSPAEKVAHLNARSPEIFGEIEKFLNIFGEAKFGIEETIEVKDQHFNAEHYTKQVRDSIEKAAIALDRELDQDEINSAIVSSIGEDLERLKAELDRINRVVAGGQSLEPEVEKVNVKINFFDFFPSL